MSFDTLCFNNLVQNILTSTLISFCHLESIAKLAAFDNFKIYLLVTDF